MPISSPLLLLLLLVFFFSAIELSFCLLPYHQSNFVQSNSIPEEYSAQQNKSREYFEITHPLPFDRTKPSCSLLVVNQTVLVNATGESPVNVPYSRPYDCCWSHVVLELLVSYRGEPHDRIVGVWMDGVELIRSSTAVPDQNGIFWKVRKDVTRYTSLLSQSNLTLSVVLQKVVDDVCTGVYTVNLTFFYYETSGASSDSLTPCLGDQKLNRKLGLLKDDETERKSEIASEKFVENQVIEYKNGVDDAVNSQKSSLDLHEKPADLILPISGSGEEGFWFRIGERDFRYKNIQIPPNTYKAVIEVYLSFHGNDEFWYSNLPDTYISSNNLSATPGHGSYREVLVTVDGDLVGSVVPFPVILPGGINPFFWAPVVAIGAFDLPSYDFDITPFLGSLLDGKVHQFGLQVADGLSYWLVDANLHLWLDSGGSIVQANIAGHRKPAKFEIELDIEFSKLDGKFETEAERKTELAGWVNSSSGNQTTHILQETKVKNEIKLSENGNQKTVKHRVKTKSEVRVESHSGKTISRMVVEREYPLTISSTTSRSTENDGTSTLVLEIVNEKRDEIEVKRESKGEVKTTLKNRQKSTGRKVVKDGSRTVLSGGGTTNQNYRYKVEDRCYSRKVEAADGRLLRDGANFVCSSSF